MIENCPMRHENGNCIPAGGFCTANKNICEALLNAYRMGKAQLSSEDATSDLISRTETVEHLRGVVEITVPITDYDGGYIDGIETGISIVSTMSPAQPETATVTRGRTKGETILWYECDACGETVDENDNYCSNCGRKLKHE